MAHTSNLSGTAHDRALAIVGRCGGGRERKDGWMVCCPVHEDRHPSLAITAKGEKVLLRCWAGCPTTAIVEAIGLCMSDLFEHVCTDRLAALKPTPCPRRKAPEGIADPFVLEWAVDLVIDDVEMLTVEGLVAVLRQAASHPLQWLWLERAFQQAGMTPTIVWQVLFPTTECLYTTKPAAQWKAGPPTVTLQGCPLPRVQLGEGLP